MFLPLLKFCNFETVQQTNVLKCFIVFYHVELLWGSCCLDSKAASLQPFVSVKLGIKSELCI